MTVVKDPEGFEKKILHQFANFSGAKVLEVGCGEGRLTFKYAASAGQVIAVSPKRQAPLPQVSWGFNWAMSAMICWICCLSVSIICIICAMAGFALSLSVCACAVLP